jgi:hypothetical protein
MQKMQAVDTVLVISIEMVKKDFHRVGGRRVFWRRNGEDG